MGLMLLFGAQQSVVLWALLVAALGLTFWETRELEFNTKTTVWWLMLVVLIHVVGYMALRVVGGLSRRSESSP